MTDRHQRLWYWSLALSSSHDPFQVYVYCSQPFLTDEVCQAEAKLRTTVHNWELQLWGRECIHLFFFLITVPELENFLLCIRCLWILFFFFCLWIIAEKRMSTFSRLKSSRSRGVRPGEKTHTESINRNKLVALWNSSPFSKEKGLIVSDQKYLPNLIFTETWPWVVGKKKNNLCSGSFPNQERYKV